MNDQEQPKREFTGVFIPAIVWQNGELSWTEKCLAAEIAALGGHRANCFASNEYLASVMGLSTRQIQHMLVTLKASGIVRQASFDGRVRKLQTMFDFTSGVKKTARQTGKKVHAGGEEDFTALTVGGKKEKNSIEEAAPACAVDGHNGHVGARNRAKAKPEASEATEHLPESSEATAEDKVRFKAFVDGWWAAYREQNGMPYVQNRAADFPAAKRITGNGRSVEELLDLARFAWGPANVDRFVWGQAQTIAGFASRLSVIQAAYVASRGKKLTAEERAVNIKNGDEYKNAGW